MKNTEFKTKQFKDATVYTLESATGMGSGSIASVSSPIGGVRKRGDNLIAQEANTDKIDASKPRNFVAKNAKTGGAGAHKDKKKAEKQGDVKHKNKDMDMGEGFPKDPNAPKLVQDRKTGKWYDPNKEFEKKMTSPEVMAQMKRMAQKEGVAEGIMNKIANKVMGAAPEQPKYRVGQRVKYETSPHQPDWKDGGRGVGVITDYKNGHYMINGNPVNHFEIKGVVGQGVAEGGEKDRQWSNKDMERLRVATRDFDDIMASDGPDQTKHDLIKKRIQTKPMVPQSGRP